VLRRIITNQYKQSRNILSVHTLVSLSKLPFISKQTTKIKSIKTNKFIISKYFSFSKTNMEQTKLENKEAMLRFLSDAKIEIAHVEDHEEIKTVNEGLERLKSVNFDKGDYTFLKNLFLKNKAGGFFLLTAHHVRKLYLIFV